MMMHGLANFKFNDPPYLHMNGQTDSEIM